MPAPEPFVPPPRRARKGPAVFGLLALLGAILAGFWFLERSEPGSLLLTATGETDAPLSGLELYLDGELVCRASPCDIAQLPQGTHFVRAQAEGYPPTADQAVMIRAREQVRHAIVLVRPKADARIQVVTTVPGFDVIVDGEKVGSSPVALPDLTVGKHTLALQKPGFAPFEREFVVERGVDATLGPFAPDLVTGKLEIHAAPGFEDAEVRLDGELVALPFERELDAREPHTLSASKPGFMRFEQAIEFASDRPTIEVHVDLGAQNTGSAERSDGQGSDDSRTGSSAATGKATLNFNSIPSSTVVLDGRPLGQTPVMGVSVESGPHNVVFVHPERGRKVVQVSVDSGAKRTVSVRF